MLAGCGVVVLRPDAPENRGYMLHRHTGDATDIQRHIEDHERFKDVRPSGADFGRKTKRFNFRDYKAKDRIHLSLDHIG